MRRIKVLDHGHVRLIDSMGGDLSIVRSARVSYGEQWRAGKDEGSDTRLIHYLSKNGHNSPSESVTLTFDVKAPIFVIRQWHRHRTQSYNETSARYREVFEQFYLPIQNDVTYQNTNNKQMRTKTPHPKSKVFIKHMNESNSNAFTVYKNLIKEGCPRELARTVLPLATYTEMFATMNLHNLFNFVRERIHEHAQKEIQDYARALIALAEDVAPVACEAFKIREKII